MEDDTDQEILALKNNYERLLRDLTDENLKLKGDTGILKKKVSFGVTCVELVITMGQCVMSLFFKG